MDHFIYDQSQPERRPLGDRMILEMIYLPAQHLPLGYDKHNPNHGWRVIDGGMSGNQWARVVADYECEVEMLEVPKSVVDSVVPRRPLDSDLDFVKNNIGAAAALLIATGREEY